MEIIDLRTKTENSLIQVNDRTSSMYYIEVVKEKEFFNEFNVVNFCNRMFC